MFIHFLAPPVYIHKYTHTSLSHSKYVLSIPEMPLRIRCLFWCQELKGIRRITVALSVDTILSSRSRTIGTIRPIRFLLLLLLQFCPNTLLHFSFVEVRTRMEEGRGVHKVLEGKPEGKRQLGRPRRRWEDKIKMDLQAVGRGCGDWMELAQDMDSWL